MKPDISGAIFSDRNDIHEIHKTFRNKFFVKIRIKGR